MSRRYTAEQIDWLREHYPGNLREDTRRRFNERFGLDVPEPAFKSLTANHRIKGAKHAAFNGKSRVFTPEMIEWLRKVYPNHRADWTLKRLNEKFGTSLTKQQLTTGSKNHHFGPSKFDGKIQPGHRPWNKGMKGLITPGSEKGWFKKGHGGTNTLPMYSEVVSDRVRPSGYREVIVKIKVPGPSKYAYQKHPWHWVRKAVWVWEQANGPVPKSHAVVHLDGDPLNCALENLACIPKGALARLNMRHEGGAGQYAGKEANPARVRLAQIQQELAEKNHA